MPPTRAVFRNEVIEESLSCCWSARDGGGADDHCRRAEVLEEEVARGGCRLDRVRRGQRLAVHGRGERNEIRAAERRPRRDARPAHDALTAAQDEEALQSSAV